VDLVTVKSPIGFQTAVSMPGVWDLGIAILFFCNQQMEVMGVGGGLLNTFLGNQNVYNHLFLQSMVSPLPSI